MQIFRRKNLVLTTTAITILSTLAACSPKDDKATTTTGSNVAATASVVAAPVTVPASSASVSTTPALTASAAPMTVAASGVAGKDNAALKADLTLLFKTLNEMDKASAKKQAEMATKMQNAKTPEAQKAFLKEVLVVLSSQKATLAKLKFTDPRVTATRDKMMASIQSTYQGTEGMMKNPTASPETHPEIAKAMQDAQQSAVEVRESLMQLTAEAGIQLQPAPAPAPAPAPKQ